MLDEVVSTPYIYIPKVVSTQTYGESINNAKERAISISHEIINLLTSLVDQ